MPYQSFIFRVTGKHAPQTVSRGFQIEKLVAIHMVDCMFKNVDLWLF